MQDPLTDHQQFTVGRDIVIATLYGDRTEPTGPVTITAVEQRWNRLGGRWCDITVRDAAGALHELDTRNAFFLSTEYQRDEWCPDCRRRRSVDDEFTTSWYERNGEHETLIIKLSCGHALQYGDRIVGAAPGAPSVGPGVVVARSHSPLDLHTAAVAQARQNAAADPWAVR